MKFVLKFAALTAVSIFLAVQLGSMPAARAKDVNLSLNEQEQTALAQVLDQATRSGGLAVTQGTLYFYNKLQQAITTANAPPTEAVKVPEPPAEPAK